MSINKVAIIGAGVMGSQIAFDLSSYNYQVILKDLTDDILQRAYERIQKDLKMIVMMKREAASLTFDELMQSMCLL